MNSTRTVALPAREGKMPLSERFAIYQLHRQQMSKEQRAERKMQRVIEDRQSRRQVAMQNRRAGFVQVPGAMPQGQPMRAPRQPRGKVVPQKGKAAARKNAPNTAPAAGKGKKGKAAGGAAGAAAGAKKGKKAAGANQAQAQKPKPKPKAKAKAKPAPEKKPTTDELNDQMAQHLFEAGRGPDPKVAKLNRELEDFKKAQAAAAAADE